jgi:hypothetical protein
MTKVRWAATAAAVCLAGVGVLGFRAGGQEAPPTVVTPPAVPKAVAVAPISPEGEQTTTVKTANFRVTAPSQRIARLVADAAERTRKEAAVSWLGKEQPPRQETCHIAVTISHAGSGGATSFEFHVDKTPSAHMQVEGPLDRLLTDVIPHEVTHVVLADHFKKPLPRWADEGVALLSESEDEQARHLKFAAQVAGRGDLIQIKALCSAREYPPNVMVFFAQSHALAKTLVERKGRGTFLNFVRQGMDKDWESAAKEHYGVGLDQLERDLLEKLKASSKASGPATSDPAGGMAPTFAWATIDPSEKLIVYERIEYYEPVTSYLERTVRVEGSNQSKTYYGPVTNYRQRTAPLAPLSFDLGQVRATTPDGKTIEEAALVAALKGKTVPVVLSRSGKLDKAFVGLLKTDVIVFTLPPPKPAPPIEPPAAIAPRN